MDYQDAVKINRDCLDEEALRIPGWFGNVIEKEAIASDRWDALKDKLSITKADIGLIIRGWSVEKINMFFGLELTKLTEDVYKNLIYIHPDIISIYNQIAEARHEALMYKSAVKSFEKKGEMLKELAKMYAQGYFMKVEGKEYKEPKIDLLIDKLKIQTITRIEREDAGKTPEPDKARKILESKLQAAKAATSKTPKPKTPKPKTPKRVRG